MTVAWRRVYGAAVWLLAWGVAPGRAQDAVPAPWQGAYEFLVQSVCTGRDGNVLVGVSPLDGAACPAQRKLRLDEALPYHKQDWAPRDERDRYPNGIQRSDSLPVRSALGLAVLQTYDFGDPPGRAFGRFDAGDGGQVAFFTVDSVAFGLTEDGGAGLQFFLGPDCRPADSWVIVTADFPARPAGETLARITRRPDRCPQRLGTALTRWAVRDVAFPVRTRLRDGEAVLRTLVSEHFSRATSGSSDSMERMYFTREIGYARWERWQNEGVATHATDRGDAAKLAGNGRCEPRPQPPEDGDWIMTDCRQWTRIVPPDRASGDPPTFWLDRLRTRPQAAALFPSGIGDGR